MADHPDEPQQIDMFRRIADDATYDALTLAEKYGLSDGQARALIRIHGPSRDKLDQVIASQPFE